ncbi:MAG: bifunctional glycosyltransferase family 2/GtrA family protein [Solirubrobacteraceae bacterium]
MSLIKQHTPAPVGEQQRTDQEGAPVLDVVVPVYNEEDALRSCVERLHAHLSESLPFAFRITVADNASTDSTMAIATQLSEELSDVRVVHLDEKGRGRALRHVWAASDASVLAYMDVDLSTDLAAVLPLIAPLVSGHSDLAIGTRLHRGSRVTRGFKREVISRSYNVILRRTLSARFSDAQCGFKAIRGDVAAALLPHVEDNGWFFDTELLVLAERSGLRIHEVPVDWIDDPDSSVHIVDTALEDLKGVWRIGTAFARGRIPLHDIAAQLGRVPIEQPTDVPPGLFRQLVRFGSVGVLSTLAYAVLYVALRGVMGAQIANAFSLLVTAIANTELNRRFTFAVRGRQGQATQQAQGLIVFGLALGLTSGTLALLHALSEQPPPHVELAVLTVANALATVLRFLLFRRWVFRSKR